LPGFYISFTDDNPRRASQVCAEITSMFVDQNLELRAARAQGTTDFISTRLKDAKDTLDEQDAKLAAFKRKNMGQLPGESDASLGILTSLNSQLEAVNQAMSRAQSDKAYLNSLLSQGLATWQATQTPEGGNPDAMQQQLSTMKTDLVKMEARYKPDHPDIIRLKDDIAQLQRKIDESAKAVKDKPDDKPQPSKAAAAEPPNIQQLRAQIYIVDQTIKEKSHEQDRFQEQIHNIQARLQTTPMVEQEYKELTRDYATAQKFYDDLLAKKNDSEMGVELERRQQGEQFRIMDPANVPEKPSYPNRPLFGAGGFGAGLGLGLGLSMLLELRDRSIRTDRDVEALLNLPTLAMVPVLGEVGGMSQSFWRRSAGDLEKHQQAVKA
jgi:polysaccharide chain length determinant protein (PEP-CTERM system associated)